MYDDLSALNGYANFQLVQFPCHHFVLGLVSTFKHDGIRTRSKSDKSVTSDKYKMLFLGIITIKISGKGYCT